MRQYKFRAKDLSGKWVFGNLIELKSKTTEMYYIHNGLNQPCTNDFWEDFTEVDKKSICQLAKTVDGVEYYDGDIAKTNDKAMLKVILTWVKEYSMFCWLTVNEYKAYQVSFEMLDFDKILFWTYAFGDKHAKDITIIGNVTDNPELINE